MIFLVRRYVGRGGVSCENLTVECRVSSIRTQCEAVSPLQVAYQLSITTIQFYSLLVEVDSESMARDFDPFRTLVEWVGIHNH